MLTTFAKFYNFTNVMNVTPRENTLRVRRAERRVNQFDVAAVVGCSRDRYWRIENGYVEPTAEERAALCAFFGVGEGVIWPALAASA